MANSNHFSLYSLIVCFALILPTYSAANALTLPIDIEGFTYHAQLSPNTKLMEKIQGIGASSTSVHYAGRLNEIENSWVRLSNIDGKWQGLVSINGTMHIIDEAGDSNTLNALNKGLNNAVLATPASAFNQELGSCGATPNPNNSFLNTINGLSNSTTDIAASLGDTPISAAVAFPELCAQTIAGVCMLAEVEFAFDSAFQSLFGSNASSNAVAIINNAEGYYRNDLDIGFDTITVEMLNSNTDVFSTTTDVYALLDDISLKKSQGLGFIKNNKALFHFITGRDFDGGVVGLAWVGTVCGSSYYTTGISQVVSGSTALTALVAAHEMGHNFGADHDGNGNTCASNTNIMGATLNASVSSFSSCSINDIKSQINTGTGNSPNLCFNFPIDLSISAAGNNPTTVQAEETFAAQYTVSVDNSYQTVSLLQIQGSLNASDGQFDSVRVDGNACNISIDSASYTCQVNNPAASITLNVEAHAVANATSLAMSHSVSDTATETIEMDPSNDTLTTIVTVTGSGAPPPVEDPAPSPSTTNTPVDDGGGSMNWWILLMLLTAVAFNKTTLRKIHAHTSV
ncbi:M12 family metallo-peptidase [Kaarinaea lacus]